MTNTINNVPRELLADLLGNDHDKRIMAERHLLAMLANAPSPAGVYGLEVVEYQERSIYGNWNRIYKLAYDKRLAAGCPEQFRTLSVTADAQAIIDGLRGENERIRLNIAEYNEAIACYQSERDHQAQRIDKLASHLEFAVTMLTVAGLAGNAQVEAMRAALSAGKEGE